MARIRILGTLKTMAVLTAATAAGFLLETVGLSRADIIAVYILGVLVVATVMTSRWYSISASLVGILLFNYIFTEPMFVLKAEDAGTQFTLLTTFLAAVFASSYTVRMKEKARLSQQDAYRSGVVLDTNRVLQKTAAPADVLSYTAKQLDKLLKRDTTCFEQDGAGLKSPLCFREYSSSTTGRGPSPDTLEELATARKCFREGKETGAATGAFPAAAYHFLPLQGPGAVYGVMGILVDSTPPSNFKNGLVAAIIAQCFMALEKEYMSRKRGEEAAMAQAEQLRSNLLRSISHDLRTLLTSIPGNTGVLISGGRSLTAEHGNRIYRDIYDDSTWLINLVKSLLSITHMEGQGIHLHMGTGLLEEIIDETMCRINRRHECHTAKVSQIGDYILADMDARLIIQVMTDLMDSTIEYTPEGSTIMVNSRQRGSSAVIGVSDNEPGISDESKEKISEMFYTIGHKSADGKRGMELGLSFCRAALSAHRGTIEVLDNRPAGGIFRLTLPTREIPLRK